MTSQQVGMRTCSLPYERAELGAEEDVYVVQYELHHHRLDADLHEGCRAAEAGRLYLLGPGETTGDQPFFNDSFFHIGLLR